MWTKSNEFDNQIKLKIDESANPIPKLIKIGCDKTHEQDCTWKFEHQGKQSK